ncbi:uncharacterized protein LOC108096484 [Drosophila ficusphila]|uniref:uncharacterized protein LOC108096484 n=1 Tax=Drosophila ficusphila TaxID=30025 RepID=UPI0007E8AC34|nr:uncharacterized protein LOC108096484 [Drosophila ficusphila]
MYKLDNLDGCKFLINPLMNRAFGSIYKRLLQQQVFKRGGSNFILEKLVTSCDRNFVEYFRKVPGREDIITFRVVKLAKTFTIDLAVRVMKTKRIMFKVDNFDGCKFLSNPLMNRAFGSVYKRFLLNGSFSCPIKPGVYYLRNEGSELLLPVFQPPGRYQITTRIRMRESRDPFVMEMLWIYNVVRIK